MKIPGHQEVALTAARDDRGAVLQWVRSQQKQLQQQWKHHHHDHHHHVHWDPWPVSTRCRCENAACCAWWSTAWLSTSRTAVNA